MSILYCIVKKTFSVFSVRAGAVSEVLHVSAEGGSVGAPHPGRQRGAVRDTNGGRPQGARRPPPPRARGHPGWGPPGGRALPGPVPTHDGPLRDWPGPHCSSRL